MPANDLIPCMSDDQVGADQPVTAQALFVVTDFPTLDGTHGPVNTPRYSMSSMYDKEASGLCQKSGEVAVLTPKGSMTVDINRIRLEEAPEETLFLCI